MLIIIVERGFWRQRQQAGWRKSFVTKHYGVILPAEIGYMTAQEVQV